MDPELEKSICLGTGIAFAFLFFLVSTPNSFVLLVLYRNPLRCFRKPFSVFLVFIATVDLFNGLIVCCGEAVMRFVCAFGKENIPQERDIVRILGFVGVNSSILLVTAMSVDRFVAVVYPHFYLRKVKPRKLVFCNAIICTFSCIFASLQLTGISMKLYRAMDRHFHTTFPLVTTALAYFSIFLFLRKRSRVGLQKDTITGNPTLHEMRRLRIAQTERKFASTSFFILLFLVISLIPYFLVSSLEAKCHDCRTQRWFFVFKESSVIFLFLNSAINPFLTTLRINELRQSAKIVFRLRWQDGQVGLHLRTSGKPSENMSNQTPKQQ